MNILFVSMEGDSLPIAQRVMKEGHRVFFHIIEKKARGIGEGMVEKYISRLPLMTDTGTPIKDNIKGMLSKTEPDLAVFDMVGAGKVADHIRSQGVDVFGGSGWADHAELNRDYGSRLMKAASIATPPTVQFTQNEYEKAIRFVERTKKAYVYKPHGNLPTSHTYVASGVEDMVEMLRKWDGEADFELQEWVDGVEVSCEMWWNGLEPLFYSWTMEEKAFMDQGVGPFIGSAGSVVSLTTDKKKLVTEGILKMSRLLKQTKYRGPIDLNAIIAKDTLYGLEFTVRLGYDAVQALLELYRGSITQLLHHTAKGTNPKPQFFPGYGISVRVSVPPYPHYRPAEPNVPVVDISNEALKHIWWSDVKSADDNWKTSGYDGIVAAVTARGSSIREARRRVYRTVSNITVPQMQYRSDIGDRVRTRDVFDEWAKAPRRVVGDEDRLRKWGWL